jgi:site-specific DNA-methyltransferase (adenine-specific)
MNGSKKVQIINDNSIYALKQLPNNSVDMVYIDPPFFSQKMHKLSDRDGNVYEFADKWDSIEQYKNFIIEILSKCKYVLKDTGSIFVHCDTYAAHIIRVLLDDIFGTDNFVNEIIWTYKRWSNSKNGLMDAHQNIYFYSKSKVFKFNKIITDYSASTNVDQILQKRERNTNGKTQYKINENGEAELVNKEGVPLSDVWYIPYLNPKAKERSGYPTQKPVILLERIIEISTNEGDVILDPFCGSGTTLVAAKLKNRNYIGIDINPDAVKISLSRLEDIVKSKSNLLINGIDSYVNKTDDEVAILDSINAVAVQRNKGIDGFLKSFYDGKPVAIRIQKKDESLTEAAVLLASASNKKGCSYSILIRINMDDINSLYTIPNNMFIIDRYDVQIQKLLGQSNKLHEMIL